MMVVVRPQRSTVVVRSAVVLAQRTNTFVIADRRPAVVVRTQPTLPPKVLVRGKGLRGEAGPQNLFVQPDEPTFEFPGVWVQTGLGDLGEDMTIWVEDGT